MSAKNVDRHNRFRSITVGFRVSPEEYYFRACSKHWIQDICSHMIPLSNSQNRKIYAFEFEDNYAYIGLSYNPVTREKEHLREKDSIGRFY